MVLFPTEEWLAAYERRLDGSGAFSEAGSGRGVGFDGDVVLAIRELPLEEATVRDLPVEAFDGLPRTLRRPLSALALDGAATPVVRSLFASARWVDPGIPLADLAALTNGRHVRDALPERTADLLEQLDRHVVDDAIYVWVGLEDGDYTGIEIVDPIDRRDAGFVLSGPYSAWVEIVDGDLDVPSAVASSALTVSGTDDVGRLAEHAGTVKLLGDAAANVETTRLF
ncbi:sterol carrier protein [Halobacteriales archaeon QS_4_69_34]|nr:MAG: sterol carrier protein [Halobacteriales archaeon QS_4_69_34]